MKKCNSISIDADGLFRAIQVECENFIKKIAKEIQELFGAYIMVDGAGRNEWRENAGKEYKIISTELTNELVKVELGLPSNIETDAWIDYYLAQIMVALYGNHPPAGGHVTKPGELTWHYHDPENARLTVKATSEAKSVYSLPSGYNWDDPHPEKMLENSFKQTKTSFKNGIGLLLHNINFYDYVHVTAGG